MCCASQEMVLQAVDTHAKTETVQALWAIRGSSFLMEAGGPDQQYQARVFDSTYTTVQCFPLVSYLRALNITKVIKAFHTKGKMLAELRYLVDNITALKCQKIHISCRAL